MGFLATYAVVVPHRGFETKVVRSLPHLCSTSLEDVMERVMAGLTLDLRLRGQKLLLDPLNL